MTEKNRTLYDPSFEHDACGIGAVVNIDGTATHKIVDNALCIVESWSTARERMRPERPATESEFLFRFRIGFSSRRQSRKESG
ncbi:MAG: hypothetical protein L6V90_12640 [Treponema succinifaciens]|nr:MAG: hypothetical protein L6V90_12640 [Treponema succinifaciens]